MLSPTSLRQSHKLIWRRKAAIVSSMLLLWSFSTKGLSQVQTQNKKYNYPGGVVELYIPKTSSAVPLARYGTREITLLDQTEQWCLLIGLDLSTLPGEYIASIAEPDVPAYAVKFDVEQTVYSELADHGVSSLDIQHSIFSELDYQNTNQPELPLKLPVAGLWISAFGKVAISPNDIVNDKQRFNSMAKALAAKNFIYLDSTQIETVLSPHNGIVSRIVKTDDDAATATVFIDHGRGLFSIITGLDQLTVEVGSGVVVGAVIGRLPALQAGIQTSKLIWQTVLNGAYVNPLILTKLQSAKP